MRARLLLTAAACSSTIALAACGSTDGTHAGPDVIQIGDTDSGGGDADFDTGPQPCTESTDCAGGQACRDGFCREICGDENPCDGELGVCDEERGFCVQCLADTDCAEDRVCDTATSSCVEPECADDGDCPGGFACEGGRCSPIDDIVCEASSTRCEGNDLLTCSRDGTREDRASCGAEAVCVGEDGAAACLPVVCEPDAVGCADAFTASLCNATGTGVDTFPCRSAEYCDLGICIAQVCEPDERTCDGNVVVACDERGASATTVVCAETEECSTSARGCSCVGGECVVRSCEPLAQQCVGNASRACNADGTAWSALEQCGDEALCIEGACLPVVCEPGSVVCVGETVATCAADGTSRELTDCGATSQICVASGEAAACQDRVCVPEARRCADEGEAVVACDVRGAGESTTACTSSEFCAEGACLPQVCSPASGNTCRDGDVFACDARGTGFDLVRDCTASETCIEGSCLPVVCEPGVTYCDGERLRACNATGTAETVTDCAGSAGWCNEEALTCSPRVCTPGAPNECRDNDVYRCNARGSSWDLVRDCTTFGCDAGVCLFPCGDGVLDAGEECDLGDGNGPTANCTAECLLNRDLLCAGVEDELCIVLPPGATAVERTLRRAVPVMPMEIAFLLDATGSNFAAFDSFIDAWVTQIQPGIAAIETGVGYGLGIFTGYPCDSFGGDDSLPWQLRQRITTRTSNMTTAVAGIAGLSMSAANFESVYQALYQAAVGTALVEPDCDGLSVAAFDPAANRIIGVQDGSVGGVGFRGNSLRVLVPISDANSGEKGSLSPLMGAAGAEVHRAAERIDARILPLLGDVPEAGAREQRNAMALATGAVAEVCEWDGIRPVVCGAGQCCTGVGLAGRAPVDGVCPLVYDTGDSELTIATSIVDAIDRLRSSTRWDVTLVPRGNNATWAASSRDTACFVAAVSASLPSVAPSCGAEPSLLSLRGINDVVADLPAGLEVSFDVAFFNDCVASSTSLQSFDLALEFATVGGRSFSSVPVRVLIPALPTPAATRCGDGFVSGSEQCDDGNRVNDDGCTNICRFPRCGDSIVNSTDTQVSLSAPSVRNPYGASGPLCDDGSTCPLGTCTTALNPYAPEHGACQALGYRRAVSVDWGRASAPAGLFSHALNWSCLDGTCFEGDDLGELGCLADELATSLVCRGTLEECDNGASNANVRDACRTNCRMPRCGDTIADTGEECDDGNGVNTDACSNACLTRACGNGLFEPLRGEECDDGVANADIANACRTNCTLPFCGDGIADSDEQCDDGNDDNDDGCNSECELPDCGNGVTEPGEECDDGNFSDADSCTTLCRVTECGDGILQTLRGEQCDDGNLINTDRCDNNCLHTALCRDGNLGGVVGASVATGSTAGTGNDFESSAGCGGSARGPDLAFSWTAPASRWYALDTVGSDFDTVLHIRDVGATFCGGPEVACNDDNSASGTAVRTSYVTINAVAGRTYLIVVDGYGSGSGNYVLNITAL